MLSVEESVMVFRWDGSGLIVLGNAPDVARDLFGRTHSCFTAKDGGVVYVNPDNVLYVRQAEYA